jgi:hypothetical protein
MTYYAIVTILFFASVGHGEVSSCENIEIGQCGVNKRNGTWCRFFSGIRVF